MNRTDIDDTVRDMWATRPRRRRDDRKIAGVAAAIGRRYFIDPVLVRVAFVVTTIFGGVGIMLYLLGWLLLPQEGDEVSGAEALIGHGRSSMSKALTVVLAIALIPASSGVFTGHLSALLSFASAGAALFLLHRHRGGGQPGLGAPGAGGTFGVPAGFAGAPTGAPTGAPVAGGGLAGASAPTATGATIPGMAATGATGTGPTATGATTSGATTTGGTAAGPASTSPTGATEPIDESGRTTPPAWDPLGAAPFAWDLPEPGPAAQGTEPPVRRRRSAVTPVTLALALMVGGAMAIAAMTNSSVGAVEVAASTLAVIGVGLVAGSFMRGGRGLVAVAIPLALVTYGLSTVPMTHFGPQYGVGDRHWQPRTAAAVEPDYRLSAGDATLDLTDLRLGGTDTVRTMVQLGLGDLKVLLPPDADVEVHCDAGLGEISCLDKQDDGRNANADVVDDGSGSGKIVLTASVGTGSVKVSR